MAQLNTRLVLRNDITSNYEAVKDDLVLLKGEVGIEFNPDLSGKVKMKVGDGVSTWSELGYFGGEEAGVYQVDSYEALPTTGVAIGDNGIVKTLISEDKYSYTAYVYTEQQLAVIVCKLRKQYCRRYVTYKLTRKNTEQKCALI